jgi:uncharacterized membrane protein SpoIIM required for sporulation
MNNKGQTLVLMVVIIPIIIFILGFVIDYGIVITEKNKMYSIGTIAINEYKNKKINVEETIFKNDNKIMIISFKNNELTLEKKIDTIFSSIIGKKYYIIKIKVRG